jgi:hypothetical protein
MEQERAALRQSTVELTKRLGATKRKEEAAQRRVAALRTELRALQAHHRAPPQDACRQAEAELNVAEAELAELREVERP